MRIPLILIAGMALVSLTGCSNEDSEPDAQNLEEAGATQAILGTFEYVQQRKNEWMEKQVSEGNLKFLPEEYSKGGKTWIITSGIGKSLEMAFCDALADTARYLLSGFSRNTESVSLKVQPLRLSPNLTVSHQSIIETGVITNNQGYGSQIASSSSQTDVSLFDLKLSCELSNNAEKIVSSFVDSRAPGCEPNERMREFLSNEMKKEGHGIIKYFSSANCPDGQIEEEHHALITAIRLN